MEQEHITPTPIKLTKKGLPDKRSITSKQNIDKAQKKVKQVLSKENEGSKIVQKARSKTPVEISDISESSASSSDSETEYTIQKISKNSKPKRAIVFQENVEDNDIQKKLEFLTLSMQDLKNENNNLKNSFIKNDHLHRINSMTKNMLLKF